MDEGMQKQREGDVGRGGRGRQTLEQDVVRMRE